MSIGSIDNFKAALIGGGARANQFRVDLTFPALVQNGTAAGLASQFMCKAAAIPDSTLNIVGVPYRGRMLKLAGDKTFENWSVTIINDTNFLMRNAFERWHNSVNNFVDGTGVDAPAAYQSDMYVHQLDRNGNTLQSYKFVAAWPASLGKIDLAFNENQTTVEEFTVDFAYQYWQSTSVGGI